MLDHVTIRVTDPAASTSFYRRVFELLEFPGNAYESADYREWNDFSIAPATAEKPATQRLHAGFAARSRQQVDAWWQALTAAGYPDAGPPGPRPEYGPEYYGGFVLDPDGNSVEAVLNGSPRADGGVIDHLWIRVASLRAAERFYETLAPTVGYEVRRLPGRVRIRAGAGAPIPSFSLLESAEPTTDVHLAFAAPDRATIDAFHRAGVAAGYRSNGAPGERPEYHRGYYGSYLLDPDGHNVEAVFHERRG